LAPALLFGTRARTHEPFHASPRACAPDGAPSSRHRARGSASHRARSPFRARGSLSSPRPHPVSTFLSTHRERTSPWGLSYVFAVEPRNEASGFDDVVFDGAIGPPA